MAIASAFLLLSDCLFAPSNCIFAPGDCMVIVAPLKHDSCPTKVVNNNFFATVLLLPNEILPLRFSYNKHSWLRLRHHNCNSAASLLRPETKNRGFTRYHHPNEKTVKQTLAMRGARSGNIKPKSLKNDFFFISLFHQEIRKSTNKLRKMSGRRLPLKPLNSKHCSAGRLAR